MIEEVIRILKWGIFYTVASLTNERKTEQQILN